MDVKQLLIKNNLMSNEDKFFLQIARASSQRAVWRNGGSNPAENDVRTRTEIFRLTCSESRRCAKPPGRCRQCARARWTKP